MTAMNPALKYAAYAVSLGYTPIFYSTSLPAAGDPPDEFWLRDIRIFKTARGWRVAKMKDNGVFEDREDDDFFATLKRALTIGVQRARPATEADLNPLLPAMRAILRSIQCGDRSNGKNAYCDPLVKAALTAIKNVTKFPGEWMEANEAHHN